MLDIVDVGWGLIGAGEKRNGVVGWRGVVLGAGFEGGASVRESADDSVAFIPQPFSIFHTWG